jgi:HlyD family secretion protein
MKRWTYLLVTGALLLAGCSQLALPEPTPDETASTLSRETDRNVIAEAVIEPVRWSELRATTNGTVTDVLAREGQTVAQGDLLVQLDTSDQRLLVQEAEAALALAKAQLARVTAGPRPEEIAAAEAELADAKARVVRAEAQRGQLAGGAVETEIAAARAQLANAETERLLALNRRDDVYGDDKKNDQDARRRVDYELYAASEALTAAESRLDAATEIGYARIRAAEAGVELASAQKNLSQAQLELLHAGVRPEEIAVTEVLIRQAKAALETATAALKDTEIRAPFAGTVTKVNVDIGETAGPGDVLVVLATLDQLQVRTSDLTELDVAGVREGQGVLVKVDALPDVALEGHVTRIDLQAVDHHGDVTYPIIVGLRESLSQLRWGMTAMIEIEED